MPAAQSEQSQVERLWWFSEVYDTYKYLCVRLEQYYKAQEFLTL